MLIIVTVAIFLLLIQMTYCCGKASTHGKTQVDDSKESVKCVLTVAHAEGLDDAVVAGGTRGHTIACLAGTLSPEVQEVARLALDTPIGSRAAAASRRAWHILRCNCT